MRVRSEVIPFVVAAFVFGAAVSLICAACRLDVLTAAGVGLCLSLIFTGYFLYFFRDPPRTSPPDESLIVAAADGVVAKIVELHEPEHLKTDVVRISIFLSLFDVHVNRSPIAGTSTFLGYFKGKHLFTFNEKSSDVNQHNKILIEGKQTRCLVTQIVGPVCRRVVYWPDHDNPVPLEKGAPIGMMKFGSRLDMYFPKDTVEVLVDVGLKVTAGETVIARIAK